MTQKKKCMEANNLATVQKKKPIGRRIVI